MSWKFVIKKGIIYDPQGKVFATGVYAGGNLGKNPEGINNPLLCAVKDIGPLPPGKYHFGEPVTHSKLGEFAIPLIPDLQNIMMGRGDFYCHGDMIGHPRCGSEGCIVTERVYREKMWASTDHEILVVADE